ncbi:MAG: amino acid adenylation domain-containing protein [Oscillospiraceae bacterium]|jgi:amino acid adenylation domain-containing protein|nr:amino acid adenylation domain-containing protein [Oscillospiraceae bacterium]
MPRTHVLDYLTEILPQAADKTAFASPAESLTFAALEAQSNAVASALTAQGLYNEPVVVYMEKSPRTVAAFFGVIKAGCYYVPLDDEMPRVRIELILDTLQPRAVIYDTKSKSAAESLIAGKDVIAAYDYARLVQTAPDLPALSAIRSRAIDTDPIYVVFTSGSTGKPKGVCACHRSVIDYVENLSDALGFDSETVFGNQAPLYVDACLKELYPTLKFGAATHFIPKGLFSFPVRLIEHLNAVKANTICWVASALTMTAGCGALGSVQPEYLRTVAFGSEVFLPKHLNAWRAACPKAKFYNLYGPTEATGMSCVYPVTRDFSEGEVIPIGKPFPNTEVFLYTKEAGLITAPDTPGEMLIRGTCLTMGYYADPERTAAAFIQNPFHDRYPEWVYCTGDLAKYDADGNLIFLSRKDYQIKHMGHRIELGEIESAALTMDGMTGCCALFHPESKKLLLAYAPELDKAAVLTHLRGKLPRYMLPNGLFPIEAMPLTPNGKIDRVLLRQTYAGA